MLDHMMKQILVQLEPGQYAELQRLVPASTRKRSEFIRNAIAVALMQLQEEKTRLAYARHPLEEPEWPFDARDWAPESEAIHPEFFEKAAKRSAKPQRRPAKKARKR